MNRISVGDTVKWKWGDGHAEGTITEKHTSPIKLTIKGTDVKRNASEDEPAFEIEQDDGTRVLKSVTELTSI